MGFADGYLQKHATGRPLISSAPDPEIHSIIAIPAYNESGLEKCLDSLFLCNLPGHPAEVIVLINSGVSSPPGIISQNRKLFTEITAWCNTHQRQGLTFHAVLLENLPKKHFGAGLARKLVMDEAVRRFNRVDHAAGIILSLDADTTVEHNYLVEVTGRFDRTPGADGCSIRFAHPLGGEPEHGREEERENGREGVRSTGMQGVRGTGIQGVRGTGIQGVRGTGMQGVRGIGKAGEPGSVEEPFPASVYDAIVNYELHQRYYLEAVRLTGYPYAFHTVGSAFAVRAGAYCRQGGMSKRQAGEDFYFIQKVAMQGKYTECNTTVVHPSPRPSDRVPFGTGPAIARQLENPGEPYLTFAPGLFRHLHDFYALIPDFFAAGSAAPQGHDQQPVGRPPLAALPALLQHYLEVTGFLANLAEIHRNVASEPAFRQRFFRKFNMFWILKYLHFAGENGVERVEVGAAARQLLAMKGKAVPPGTNRHELLEIYRKGFAG